MDAQVCSADLVDLCPQVLSYFQCKETMYYGNSSETFGKADEQDRGCIRNR